MRPNDKPAPKTGFRLRLDHKLALVFCLFAVLVSGATAYSFYRTAKHQVVEDIRQRLYDIVAIAPQVIDVEKHSKLTDPSQEGSEEYLSIKKKLREVRDAATDVHFIYTMRLGPEGKIVFVVDAESNPDDIAHLGEIYDDPSEMLKKNFASLSQPVVEASFYTDEWGTWLSGYAPFFNKDGSRAGVLGVDISAATVIAYEDKLLHLSLMVFLLALPIITLFGYLIGRRLARPILVIKEGAEKIGQDDLDMRIDIERQDEIGALAQSFNEMTRKLKVSRTRLSEMMEKYRNIFENAIEGIFQTSEDGRFISANRSLARLLGYDSAEELLASVTDLREQVYADPEARLKMLAVIKREGRVTNYETQFIRKDGSPVWVEMNAQQLDDPRAGLMIEGMVQDITARRAKEEAEKERRIAEEATQAKSSFLANMSHEIRTPLNAVMGLTDLMLRTDLSAKQSSYLQKIKASGRSLLAVVNDILDLSKIEAGRLELEETDFSLYEVMANISEMFAYKAYEKDVEFLVSIDEKVPCALIGDPVRLGQVLINLTGNALKFTEAGEVVVSVAASPESRQPDGDEVRLVFSVSDTGSGIPPERVESIFDSFTQADSSTTRKHGGTGLGLTICRQITRMMGGDIRVTSEPGQGSVFSFDAVFCPQPAEREIRPLPPSDLRGLNILIVDDNKTSQEILANFIESFKMKATTVSSGEAAIEAVSQAENPFDLILMDWRMPGLNGIETAKRIKQNLDIEKIPIICMVSAYGREDLIQQAEKTFLDAFLHKPVNQSFLFDTIMELFGREGRIMSAPAEQPFDEPASLAGVRVLLVEDNEVNREIAREWLESVEIEVEEAKDGQEALDMIKSGSYDAVLMDIQMPVFDGLEATRRVRQIPELATLPIIAMTAHALKGDRERCLQAGMNDYLTKPIDPRQLISTLAYWVEGAVGPAPGLPVGTVRATEASGLEIPGVDTNLGLYRANGKLDLYLKLLTTFARDFSGADREIIRLFDEQETDSARLLVHSIKGVAANVGAADLGEKAALVEERLVNGALDLNSGLWRDFASMLSTVISGIENVAQDRARETTQAEGIELSADALAVRLEELAGVLEEDLDQARKMLEELKPALSVFEGEESEKLYTLVEDFDLDGAEEILGEMIKRLKQGEAEQ